MIAVIGLALLLTQCPQPLTVVQGEKTTSEYEHDLWMEHAQLMSTPSLTAEQQRRLAAITGTLGTIPNRCSREQARAELCIRIEDLRRSGGQ